MPTELRRGLRVLARARLTAIAAVLVLATCVGLNTALFSFANAVWLRPAAIAEARGVRLVYPTSDGRLRAGLKYGAYQELVTRLDSTDELAATVWDTAVLLAGRPLQLRGEAVSAEYFEVLSAARPVIGRYLSDADTVGRLRRAPPVVISAGLWQSRFAEDAGVVGTTLSLTPNALDSRIVWAKEYEIVGVAPQGFAGTGSPWQPSDYWVLLDDRQRDWFCGEARLVETGSAVLPIVKPFDGNDDALLGRLSTVATGLGAVHYPDDQNWGLTAVKQRPSVIPFAPEADPLVMAIALVAVGMGVLAIGLINLGSLYAARMASARSEVMTRRMLGAGRWRAQWPILIECCILALAGCIAGIVMGRLLLTAVLATMPVEAGIASLRVALEVPIDGRVLAFAVALVGLVLLAVVGRPQQVDFVGDAPRPGRRTMQWLVAIAPQVAIALAVLTHGGALASQSLAGLTQPMGFDSSELMWVRYTSNMPSRCEPAPAERPPHAQIAAAIASVPGVRSATVADALPFESYFPLSVTLRQGGEVVGAAGASKVYAGSNYFDTIGTPLLAGRYFTLSDEVTDASVAILPVTMASRLFPSGSALGQEIGLQGLLGDVEWHRVVGVVGDTRAPLRPLSPEPFVYVPLAAGSPGTHLLARVEAGTIEPYGLSEALGSALPLAVFTAGTVEDAVRVAQYPQRVMTWLVGVSGVIALVVTCVGLIGNVWFLASRRRQELALRLALGAEVKTVVVLVVRDGLVAAGAGVVAGGWLAWWSASVLSTQFDSVPAPTWWIAAACGMAVAVAVVAACLVPARNVAATDPASALRAL